MKKINYKGSIAEDVKFLKGGNKKAFTTALVGVAGFVATGFLPVTVPVAIAGASFVGFSAMALGGAVKMAYNDLVKKPKAQKRLYGLLNAMGVKKSVNEHDIKVATDIPMKIKNVKKFKETTGNYIIVDEGTKKHFVREAREVKSDDLKAYRQYILDMSNPLENNLAATELEEVENVIVLRRK